MSVPVRRATLADAPRIADLSRVLGYPVERGVMSERLASVAARDDDAIFVAEDKGVVIGWIHGAERHLLGATPGAREHQPGRPAADEEAEALLRVDPRHHRARVLLALRAGTRPRGSVAGRRVEQRSHPPSDPRLHAQQGTRRQPALRSHLGGPVGRIPARSTGVLQRPRCHLPAQLGGLEPGLPRPEGGPGACRACRP